MKALIIKASGETEVKEIASGWKLGDMQAVVGGNIESLPQPFKNTGFYGNDEAKYAGPDGSPLPLNMLATLICQSRIADNDVICGDVVVLGVDWDTGESESVSDFVIRAANFISIFVKEKMSNLLED